MQDITSYISSIVTADDNQPLASKDIPSDQLPPEVKSVLDAIFDELISCKPSWRSVFKEKEEVVNYKKALGVAMLRAKIDTVEKAQFGIAFAQLDESPFFPSVGEFIKWCKDGYNTSLHFKQLEDNTKRIKDERRMISAVPWEEQQKTARDNLAALRKTIKTIKKGK